MALSLNKQSLILMQQTALKCITIVHSFILFYQSSRFRSYMLLVQKFSHRTQICIIVYIVQ